MLFMVSNACSFDCMFVFLSHSYGQTEDSVRLLYLSIISSFLKSCQIRKVVLKSPNTLLYGE